jgi:hypothetical protein
MSTNISKYKVYKEYMIPIFKMSTNSIDMRVSIPPNDTYRYYHCYEDVIGLKCKKVSGPDVLPAHQNTKLLFVRNYIPERLDVHILKYKWMPSNVHIE